MKYSYAVLGAGRQGTAAAFDIGLRGDAGSLVLADADFETACQAADRVNRLLGTPLVQSVRLDVTDLEAVSQFLEGTDAFLSAVPYHYNLGLARAALQARASMCDLGGNTLIVRQQHAFDEQARQAGISIIPDCGQVPGLGTSLVAYAIGLLDEAVDVYMWDGGIPQDPKPPFKYLLTFNIAGLTNEYAEPAIFIRDGEIVEVEPMTGLETVDFPPPIGRLEAFVAGGGTSSMPWTYQGRLRTLQNLTLRHPGHFAQLRAFWDLGLWSLDPIQAGGVQVVPRQVFHALFEPKVTAPGEKDVVIVRVQALGEKDGRPAQATVELIDYYDETTGFTAMERSTGWSAAIVAEMMAHGQIQRGAGGVETFVPSALFVAALRQRGFQVTEKVVVE
jgi:lysine 6-dehydrogenase